MAEKILNTKIALKRGIEAEFAAENPLLLKGEIYFVETPDGNVNFKVGDGESYFNDLPYSYTNPIVKGYYLNNKFYKDESHLVEIEPNNSQFYLDLHANEIYFYEESFIKISGGGSSSGADENTFIFKEDLEVMYKLGKYEGTLAKPTKIDAKGKTFKEVWNDIFQNEVNPVTTQPTVNLTFNQAGSYEVGTVISPTWSASFNKGSYTYGPDTGVEVSSWEITNSDGSEASSATGTFNDIIVGDDTYYTITAKANHNEGAIPLTNLGNPYIDGQIKAGYKSKLSSPVKGFRKIFWGYSAAETIDSAAIRALAGNKQNAKLTNELLQENTDAKEIIIAAPKGTRTMVSVTMPSSSEANVTSQFVKQDEPVYVNGLDGYTWAEYDVWLYKPATMAGTYKINMN